MTFQWPDPISLVADLIAIFGIPTLAYSTKQLYNDLKKARETKIVSFECVEFHDVDANVAVNLVPFENMTTLPRVGDEVYLPGDIDDQERKVSDIYKVLKVLFIYNGVRHREQPTAAIPAKICIDVRSKNAWG